MTNLATERRVEHQASRQTSEHGQGREYKVCVQELEKKGRKHFTYNGYLMVHENWVRT